MFGQTVVQQHSTMVTKHDRTIDCVPRPSGDEVHPDTIVSLLTVMGFISDEIVVKKLISMGGCSDDLLLS